MDGRKISDLGVGTYIRNLLDRFRDMDTAHRFRVLLDPEDAGSVTPVPGKLEIRFNRSGKYSLAEQLTIPLRLLREKADLFHSPHYVAPLLKTGPFVVTIHDAIHLLYPQYLPNALAHAYAKAFFRNASRAEHILTVSEWSKRDLCRLLGIPEGRVTVTHLAADPLFRDLSGSAWKTGLKGRFGIDRPYLLFVGNFKPHKNVDGLIRIFHRLGLAKSHSLVLVGRGWDRDPALGRMLRDFSLESSVRILENTPPADLNLLYNGAALFVFPSFYEGFGLPPLESMACGTPVAASNASCIPEILGDAAHYFDPSDEKDFAGAVRDMMKDGGLRKEMIEKGRKRTLEFSWDKTAVETMRVYDRFAR